MSRINVENIRHPDAASDSLQLSDTGNITAPGNLSVTGTSTLTGNTVVTGSLTANGLAYPTAGPFSNRNLIINGAMQVSQRGTTDTVTNTKDYLVDRWYGIAQDERVTQSQESSVVPTGFKNSLKFEVTSAGATGYLQCVQRIEGQNMAHLNFGTANAVQFTLSFYVRSSITGNYSIAFRNGSDNRSYVTTYNIATANTWERKTVTLTGDTTGTWATDNGHGMSVIWTLGYSTATSSTDQWTATGNFAADSSVDLYETNGATWYITGAQLEVGSVATPFEHRSYGDELARCQRYYYKVQATRSSTSAFFGTGFNRSTTSALGVTFFPVQMRVGPEALEQSGTASDYSVNHNNTQEACTSVPAWFDSDNFSARTSFTTGSNLTQGQGSILRSASTDAFLAWSAEL
jgi:hypothetical protein